MLVAAAVAATIMLAGFGAQPVGKKVDHVAIKCSDPEALFKVFTETLGLPVAWPFSSYPGFETGGVQAGNVNIETLRYGPPDDTGTSLYGIVLEPYPLDEAMDEFDARGRSPRSRRSRRERSTEKRFRSGPTSICRPSARRTTWSTCASTKRRRSRRCLQEKPKARSARWAWSPCARSS